MLWILAPRSSTSTNASDASAHNLGPGVLPKATMLMSCARLWKLLLDVIFWASASETKQKQLGWCSSYYQKRYRSRRLSQQDSEIQALPRAPKVQPQTRPICVVWHLRSGRASCSRPRTAESKLVTASASMLHLWSIDWSLLFARRAGTSVDARARPLQVFHQLPDCGEDADFTCHG